MSNGSGIEDEFRAMFAERSADVPLSAAPYGRLKQRIAADRKRRRQQIGGATLAMAVVAAGAGAWATAAGNQSSKRPPASGSSPSHQSLRFTYADGSAFADSAGGYVGYMKQAALTYLASHDVKLGDGPYTVVTTFDHQMMEDAKQAADSGLWRAAADSGVNPAVAGPDVHLAFAAVDPSTGAVKAFYNGVDGVEDAQKYPFNDALDGHEQIADLMKPITLATGLENGFTADSKVPGTNSKALYWPPGAGKPITYVEADHTVHNWPPRGFDEAAGVGDGQVTLRRAMAYSANAPFAAVELDPNVGPQKVYEKAMAMGIPADTADFNASPALTLGVLTTSPLTLASAYGTFAASGVHHEPVTVTEVRDSHGAVVWKPKDTSTTAMSASTAHQVTDVLKDVLTDGTAGGNATARQLARSRPDLAGKTSTTEFDHAVWFSGYDSTLSTTVTIFRQAPGGVLESLQTKGGPRVNGMAQPTTVWATFTNLAPR